MAIISFYSSGNEETGKSSSVVAITTSIAINHNYKILVLDTKYNDDFYKDCYWKKESKTDVMRTDISDGISGLSKAILSNKTSPEIITNYTKIVFKNTLEILMDTNTNPEEYIVHKKIFKSIAKIASKYYDLIFIDIDTNLDKNIKESLLEISDLIVVSISQKLRTINDYLKAMKKPAFQDKLLMPLIGKYDVECKYTARKIGKYFKEKERVCKIPYNTLFFEACNEGKAADFFIKYIKVNRKDKNWTFINEVTEATEQIINRLQELQMKM